MRIFPLYLLCIHYNYILCIHYNKNNMLSLLDLKPNDIEIITSYQKQINMHLN